MRALRRGEREAAEDALEGPPRGLLDRLRRWARRRYRRRVKEPRRFWIWRLLSRLRFGEARPVAIYGAHRIFVRTDDIRAFRVAEQGGTQKEKIAVWEALARLGPEVCVDVGANFGEFSAVAAGTGLRVVSIEANPQVVPCLKMSFADRPNVTVVHAAASDKAGTVSFFFNPHASGASSLAEAVTEDERQLLSGLGRVGSATIEARRLDEVVPAVAGGAPKSFILKVDVEGFEELVLRGATALLERAGWWRALFEFNPGAVAAAGSDPARLWATLRGWPGYVIAEPALGIEGIAVEPRAGGAVDPRLVALEATLPEKVPERRVDVIVGKGRPG